MNDAIRQNIGGKKARERLGTGEGNEEAGPGKKLPKEAIAFARQMGIDMTGIEAEAEDMWRSMTEMYDRSPLEYHAFVKDQMDQAKIAAEEEKIRKQKGEDSKKSSGDDGKFFRPEAAFAFKVNTDGGDGVKVRIAGECGRELNINVCKHRAISPPLDKNGKEVLDDRATADGLQIPLIVGPLRELSLIDSPLAVDVVVHPSVTLRCDTHKTFLVQMVDLILEWVKEETKVIIYKPKKGGAYWNMCTNVYIGGRGEFGEIPVLFPLNTVMEQGKPKEERDRSSTSQSKKADKTSIISGEPSKDFLSAPSTLLNLLRNSDSLLDDDNDNDNDILPMLKLEKENKKTKKPLIQDLSQPAGPKKCLIQDLSEPDAPLAGPTLPPELAKIDYIEDNPSATSTNTNKKKVKPSIKKGFLSNPKAAGKLYPDGSNEGTGTGAGGAYARVMSKCQVVDTSSMTKEQQEKVMEDYAKTGKNPSAKKSGVKAPPVPSTTRPKDERDQGREMTPTEKARHDNLSKEMDKLMASVDDDWNLGHDENNLDAQMGEWDNVFKDLAKALAPGATDSLSLSPDNPNFSSQPTPKPAVTTKEVYRRDPIGSSAPSLSISSLSAVTSPSKAKVKSQFSAKHNIRCGIDVQLEVRFSYCVVI